MRREYGDRLVVYDALRSERNAFADKRISDNYKKGEDALVDALALSCSNFLIKPASALSEFSVYWNTALHNHVRAETESSAHSTRCPPTDSARACPCAQTYEIQYESGLPDGVEALEAHLASPRDRVRGFARCAEAMALCGGDAHGAVGNRWPCGV